MISKRLLFGLPLIIGLYASLFFIIRTPDIWVNESISFAFTFDFLVLIPIVYFLIIRKTAIPNISIVPLLVLSMILSGLVLPESQQWYLNGFKTWIFPLVEITVISLIIWRVRSVIKAYQTNKREQLDFFSTLTETCKDFVPSSFVMPLATEISVFYYGFFKWRKRTLATNEFSYHKSSGAVTLLVAIIGVVAIEMVTLHVLLAKWSPVFAWVMTILSCYSALQIFGFAKAIVYRPIQVTEQNVVFRFSILKEAIIPFEDIESIELTTKDLDSEVEIAKLSLLHGLEGHNVVVTLKNKHEAVGLYGRKTAFDKMALHIDDKGRFAELINTKISF